MSEDSGTWKAAFVTANRPVQVVFAEYRETDPFEVFDEYATGREYPFDPDDADSEITRAGYERITDWRPSDQAWGCAVQPKPERK